MIDSLGQTHSLGDGARKRPPAPLVQCEQVAPGVRAPRDPLSSAPVVGAPGLLSTPASLAPAILALNCKVRRTLGWQLGAMDLRGEEGLLGRPKEAEPDD